MLEERTVLAEAGEERRRATAAAAAAAVRAMEGRGEGRRRQVGGDVRGEEGHGEPRGRFRTGGEGCGAKESNRLIVGWRGLCSQ